jgi:NADPH-dependent ferric siderophore reductase
MLKIELTRYDHQFGIDVIEVTRVEDLAPSLRRVTSTGDGLEHFASLSPDDHVKLLFPTDGDDTPVLPTTSGHAAAGRRPTFPSDRGRPAMRDYTVRGFDPTAGELMIDFVVHGAGPASSWAASAKPGDRLAKGGPRGSRVLAGTPDWCVLAGDETALPAIGRWLEQLTAQQTRTIAFVEAGRPRP